jgi:hypothetical protein
MANLGGSMFVCTAKPRGTSHVEVGGFCICVYCVNLEVRQTVNFEGSAFVCTAGT